jgi:DNA-binding NtrC family response regulator
MARKSSGSPAGMLPWLGLAVLILIADQFTKVLILGYYQLGDSSHVTSFFNVVRVHMPPLRDRKEDMPSLISHFLRRFNQRFRREVTGISPEALATLSAYDFPGNVRELENLIERAYAMGARDHISLADLPSLTLSSRPSSSAARPLPSLAEVEKELILRALSMYKNDKEQSARALGLSRRTIYRRLKEYGLL